MKVAIIDRTARSSRATLGDAACMAHRPQVRGPSGTPASRSTRRRPRARKKPVHRTPRTLARARAPSQRLEPLQLRLKPIAQHADRLDKNAQLVDNRQWFPANVLPRF